ncbi:MAG: BMP family ABC transporter substrate-binding protein [Candidatus Hydrogenedens sp.]|nr:BMP family ABC transporter substrate-binding protein [Candidatus Hydrogenedens sp.]
MKKIVTLILVFVLALSVFGCTQPAGQPEATPTPPPAAPSTPSAPPDISQTPGEGEYKQYPDFKVAALLSGVITDNGWSANMYNAVMNLADKYGVTADYVESVTVSDMEEYLRGFAGDGYGLVIAHGSQFIDVVNAVAGDYPDTLFAISFAATDVSQHDNVACIAPVNQGILEGIAAGALTKTNKVAMLGSEENPSISGDINVFESGVRLVNADAEVITGYIGSATDADKGKEMAMTLISSGVDVITHQANAAGLGVLQAAEEAGILAVGINTDQYSVAPDAVVTSVLRNFPAIYEALLPDIAEGKLTGGLYRFGIKEQGCVFSDWHGWDAKLPAEIKLIQDTVQGIIDGTIAEP